MIDKIIESMRQSNDNYKTWILPEEAYIIPRQILYSLVAIHLLGVDIKEGRLPQSVLKLDGYPAVNRFDSSENIDFLLDWISKNVSFDFDLKNTKE
jgi:hypothetical protein